MIGIITGESSHLVGPAMDVLAELAEMREEESMDTSTSSTTEEMDLSLSTMEYSLTFTEVIIL